jgi:hypothetical protein
MTPEYTLPEFTRSLRALAVPSAPGSDHDVVFAPLLESRRTAHRATSVEQQVAAFDAGKLERGWRGAIASLAERRHAKSLPDRRALAAELELLASPLWQALIVLKERADLVKQAPAEQRATPWAEWVKQLHVIFREADAWWERAMPVLADPRGRRGAFWRRVLRQGL